MLTEVGAALYQAWKIIWRALFRLLHRIKWALQRFSLPRRLYQPDASIRIKGSVLSLTTSPERLATSLPRVLDAFQHQVDAVELNLPRLYRNEKLYDESAVQALRTRGVNVFWQDKDLGPVLKLLPTAERYAGQDKVIFTLDDDAIPVQTALKALEQETRAHNAVATFHPRRVLQSHMVYGNKGVCYPSWLLHTAFIETLRQYAEASPACRNHDDFTIGAALVKHNIQVAQAPSVHDAFPLDEGADAHALWAADLYIDKDLECAKSLPLN